MKEILKISSIVVFLVFGAFMISSKTQAVYHPVISTKAGNDFDKNKNSVKNLYLNNCARCHGADGKGETELGRTYGAKDLTDKNVKKMSGKKMGRLIQNGTGIMPAFKKKLTGRDVSALVNYVRSL